MNFDLRDRVIEVAGSISFASFVGSEQLQKLAAAGRDSWHYLFLDESLKLLSIVTCAITIYTFLKNIKEKKQKK